MNKQVKIEGTVEAWESGDLGREEEYVAMADDAASENADDSMELQMISIRLQKSLIEDLKLIAKHNGLGYQPLIKRFLTRFAESEKRLVIKDMIKEKELEAALNEKRVANG